MAPPPKSPRGDLVYNPTNALYFMRYLAEFGKPPGALHDENLRTDSGKLAFLARTHAGSKVIEDLTEGDGTLEITKLKTSFSLEDLLTHVSEDEDAVASFLYYMGLLTRTRGDALRLRIPNLVVRKLFLDRLLELEEAESQVRAYRDALVGKIGEVRPRCYAVVAVGLERVLGHEVS